MLKHHSGMLTKQRITDSLLVTCDGIHLTDNGKFLPQGKK